ncbi:MAG: hypothetical protein ACUVTF_06915 [bacterium]
MNNKIKKYFLLLIVISVTFCKKNDTFEFEPMFNIACILRNDQPHPVAIIDRTYRMDEPAEYDLQDAIVWISGAGIVDTLHYWGGKHFSSGLYLSIMPESTYQIVAQAKGLPTLTGSTKIPGKFRIISPANFETVPISDTIKFTKSKGGAVYYVFCGAGSLNYYVYWIYLPGLFEDSIMDIPIRQFQDCINESGLYHFIILAHDTNYYNYEFHWKTDYPAYGVENGVGFFGSAWAESVLVYIDLGKK